MVRHLGFVRRISTWHRLGMQLRQRTSSVQIPSPAQPMMRTRSFHLARSTGHREFWVPFCFSCAWCSPPLECPRLVSPLEGLPVLDGTSRLAHSRQVLASECLDAELSTRGPVYPLAGSWS